MQIKKAIVRTYGNIIYPLYNHVILSDHLTVIDLDRTIDMLLETENSFVRFGDGEIRLIEGDDLPLQPGSPELAKELAHILVDPGDGLCVGIPDIFLTLDMYRPESQAFWKEHLVFFRRKYRKHCDRYLDYYDAFFSRLHYMYDDFTLSEQRFARIRQIWAGRDLLVIESKSAHTGVDNNLLDTAASVHRIIGPESDTYSVIGEIEEHVKEYPADTMVLVSAGPAAKPLVYRLHQAGYRCIDIGSLDLEYMWFTLGIDHKCHVPKKDCLTAADDRAAGYDTYLKQIDHCIGVTI